jgi:putative FmdB family regulatory protein
MPIYEYRCDKCEREFEAEQRITDDPLRSCPHCRSRKVRRLISQTSFVLKGKGWYSDLYSSSKSSKPEPAAADAAGESKKSSEAKPESKEAKGPKDTKGPDSGGGAKKKSEPKAAA